MVDGPPDGYSGGSILPIPREPIEMHRMAGGGGGGGGGGGTVTGGADMLSVPDKPLVMQKFVGGAAPTMAAPKGVAPTMAGPKPSAEPKEPPAGPKGQTIPISAGGLRVRYVDESIKADIHALRFTPEENLLFTKYLNLGHPFIRKYLTSAAVKDRFYEFWRLYVNYDGANNYHLMTYAEGKKCQDFLKGVLEAYKEYLTTTALTLLRKSDNPETLIESQSGPIELLETYEYKVAAPPAPPASPEPPATPAAASPPAPPAPPPAPPPASPPIPSDTTSAAAPPAASPAPAPTTPEPSDTTPLNKETLKKELQEFIKTQFNDTKIDSEKKIMNVIEYLNTKIDTRHVYATMYKNATEIGAVSFSGNKVSQIEIIKQSESKTKGSVSNFLRWLIKTDVSTFKRANKEKFYDFFQKVVSTGALKPLAELKAAVLAPNKRITRKSSTATSARSRVQT